MSWQKCPICNGCGYTGVGFPVGEICTVCRGMKIISDLSGLPPDGSAICRNRATRDRPRMSQSCGGD